MSIERFGSGGPFEGAVGYSRAVRAGDFVYVAGCTAVGDVGQIIGGDDAYAQALQACENVIAALAQAGGGAEDVVQTRIYVTDVARWEAIGRAHAEAFGAAPPVASMVQVSGLIDPRMLVEIEAVAFVP
ncbi:MAG: endoribonuclease [Solirubrobacteraceae bacterium]|nr:endoribonuclease [Solirubrobacteraceae bacterium]